MKNSRKRGIDKIKKSLLIYKEREAVIYYAKNRQTEIFKLAKKTLRTYKLHDYPTDPIAFAKRLGLEYDLIKVSRHLRNKCMMSQINPLSQFTKMTVRLFIIISMCRSFPCISCTKSLTGYCFIKRIPQTKKKKPTHSPTISCIQ